MVRSDAGRAYLRGVAAARRPRVVNVFQRVSRQPSAAPPVPGLVVESAWKSRYSPGRTRTESPSSESSIAVWMPVKSPYHSDRPHSCVQTISSLFVCASRSQRREIDENMRTICTPRSRLRETCPESTRREEGNFGDTLADFADTALHRSIPPLALTNHPTQRSGGERGIRTPGPLAESVVFKRVQILLGGWRCYVTSITAMAYGSMAASQRAGEVC